MVADAASQCLVVMARAPVAGRVKTRLIPYLGRQRATRVYHHLLVDTVRRLGQSSAYSMKLSCTPDTRHPLFHRLARDNRFSLARQPAGDLGQRMLRIFSHELLQHESVIIVGTDLVNLDAGLVEQAFADLQQGADVVLARTLDGGYGLIGMNRLCGRLFLGIPWSTSRVADVTVNKARRLGLTVQLREGLCDIDEPLDYVRWKKTARQLTENTGFRNAIP
jgi:rSAM/selenodomain-associated transferase 1